MQCAEHPERTSVGYCKKCGTFGCSECLIKVSLTGQVGKTYSATDVLFCRDCLSRARPDLAIPEVAHHHPEKSSKRRRTARSRSIKIRVGKRMTLALIVAAVVVAIAAAVAVIPRSTRTPRPTMPPDEFASRALAALSEGDREAFLSCVDVREFMSEMDKTGLTRRDYLEADREQKRKMEASHYKYLADVLFVPANTRRDFTLVSCEIGENEALVRVKPWITYGRKSYRRILLENKMGQWRISGLTSPDF